jgi:release factor glutamine methyltransferase
MTSIKQALKEALNTLSHSTRSPRIDAEILLGFVLTAYLYTYPEQTLDASQKEIYQELIIKRREGSPIAYLIGHREFFSLPLFINNDTLIPRPETELLVELTLKLLKDLPTASVIDLGTGSGAIALALAFERPNWQLLACDIKPAALAVAKKNASQLNLTNVQLCCSDWFTSIPEQRFNAVISNPPYIAKNDPHLELGDLRFEPKEALISGQDGLTSLRYIIKHSYDRLLPGGLLLLEHGYEQKEAVAAMLKECNYERTNCWQDLHGHDRVSGGWRIQ